MKKPMTVMVIALLIVFGGLIGFNVLKGIMIQRFFANYKPPAVTVSSVTAKAVYWQPQIDAVGNFLAISGVDVNAETAGNVTAIHFNSGEFIKEGQPLIDIDDSVEQATLKFNKAELTLKEISYKRQQDLYKRGATPSSSVDEATANLKQAEANVEKTMAEIKQKHITAPFTGRLGIRQVNLGQYINPGQTTIVSLQSMDPLYLEFYLPEQLFKKIKVGQPLNFKVDGFDAFYFKGKISAINSKVDPNTHNILVQATVPNCPASGLKSPKNSKLIKLETDKVNERLIAHCDSQLNQQHGVSRYSFLPGMFASIEISRPPLPDTIVLPSTAISYSLYGNSVYIIEKDDKESEQLHVKRVFVRTGEQRGNYTVVLSGVKAGQQVVSSGQLKLQDGTPVTINNDVELKDIKDPDLLGQ